MRRLRESSLETRLGVAGIGAGLATFALGLLWPRVPQAMLYVMLVGGLLLVMPLLTKPLRDVALSRDSSTDAVLSRQDDLLRAARECSRVRHVLRACLAQHATLVEPSAAALGGGHAALVRAYQLEIRVWATAAFDDAVRLGATSSAGRPRLAGTSWTQIESLPTLFEELQAALERRAGEISA